MASMPELGSKISLISKSDIRYEGQLYTVDPAECTIALANGKSFQHITTKEIFHRVQKPFDSFASRWRASNASFRWNFDEKVKVQQTIKWAF